MPDHRIITLIQSKKTVAATGTPEALVADETPAQWVEMIAQKDQGSANTGSIWYGPSSADATNTRLMATGAVARIDAPAGQKINLADIFIDVATNGDGVTFTYFP